jgi:YVTN family beta-propeller protein
MKAHAAMKGLLAAGLLALLPDAVTAQPAQAGAPLVLEATIPLPNVSGRIDHLAVDIVRKHLFVAELGNNSVDVIDLANHKIIQRISGLSEPQGLVYVPDSDLLVVANGRDGSVRMFGGADFVPHGVTPLSEDADNVRLDPRTGHVLVGYGSGGLAIIDPKRGLKLADIPLPDHPESFQLSLTDSRVFVNIPNTRVIAIIDLEKGKTIETWSPNHSSNFPMALDAERHVLGVVFRSPPHLTLMDSDTGKVKGDIASCSDADDVFFDKKRHRYYVSCGAGEIDVYDAVDEFRSLAKLSAPSGGRTSLFVPDLDRLFVAVRAGMLGSNASLEIYRPN